MLTFRSVLKKYEEKNKTTLYSSLIEIEKSALESWANQFGENYGSYNGIPHFKNVELHLNNAVPDALKKQFLPTEIFILLASVLLHDIGKLFKTIYHKSEPDSTDYHAYDSAIYIQEEWPFLKIPSKQFSRWIAILSCSHCWKNPLPNECNPESKSKCTLVCCNNSYSELNVLNESSDGIIRLNWLAALLRLADEVDNQFTRAVPEELEGSVKDLSWRRLINSVIFDKEGECIKLRMVTLENLNDVNYYTYIREAIDNINSMLKLWGLPLKEMNLKYKKAFIEVSIPAPALISGSEITVQNFNEKNLPDIKCSFEPAFNDFLPDKLTKAMIKMENSIINKDFKSWESLAEEIGVGNPLFAKKIADRMNSITHCRETRYKYENADKIESMVISDAGWKLDKYQNIDQNINIAEEPQVISTNIENLDTFLYPESKNKKGFTIFTMRDGSRLTPIIAIIGSSGEGKTTLCLQIAAELARNTNEKWCSVFYSVEESVSCIIQQLDGHKFLSDGLENKIINLEKIKFNTIQDFSNKIIFPSLSIKPVDIKSMSHERLFEERYNDLRISIKSLKEKHSKDLFYFIDSLTAFSHQSLSRNEINRIFRLFRNEEIPLIITLERQSHWAIYKEEIHYNYAKYLSDVIISLESDYKNDYFRQTIEVTKSRFTRRILGKHLMKIKSKYSSTTGKFDDRNGIVIYQSIHNHLVHSRYEQIEKTTIDTSLPPDLPIFSNVKETIIDSDSCIVITGPHGSHKLALGLNILLGIKSDRPSKNRKLIISFAEEKEIKLENVALFEKLEFWRDKLKRLDNPIIPQGSKVWEFNFGKGDNIYVTILNFRLGQIPPEEFFYILNKYLQENQDLFDGVLVTTTSQIKTRFPLLNQEPLFFPVLVDIIKSKGFFSIFIDALDADNEPQPALQSAADCAIFIERDDDKDNILTVENIRGKNYDRLPRIYTVDEKRLNLKIKTRKNN